MARAFLIVGLAGLSACQLLFPLAASEEPSADAGLRDGAPRDAQTGDGGPADAGPVDAGPTDAGATVVVEAPDGDVVRCVATDATHVYWSDETAMTLMQSALDGSNATVLLMAVDIHQMFVAGSKLYYYGNYGTALGLHVLDLVAHTNQFLTPDIQGCVWVTATDAYSVNDTTSIVYRIDPDSGATTQLLGPADGVTGPWGVAVDDTYLYWSNRDTTNTGSVLRRLLDGGSTAQTTSLASQQSRPQCLTLDGTGLLYWTNYDDGTIHRIQVDGGGETVLVSGQTTPTQVALTTQFLFWNSGSEVVRMPR
jgi:sugar lactone lactonase YvrE